MTPCYENVGRMTDPLWGIPLYFPHKGTVQWRFDIFLVVSMNKTINSLAPGRSSRDFEDVIFNLALLIDIFKSSYDNVLRWMPYNLTGDKSTLVQVMAWCRQATSHYLNQCWLRSPTPYGVTRPQWVEQIVDLCMIWYARALMWRHCNVLEP